MIKVQINSDLLFVGYLYIMDLIKERKLDLIKINQGLLEMQSANNCFGFYFNTCILHLLSFCTLDQQMHTIISQIITLLHVSTLSCHLQTACNHYLYSASIIILYNEPTNAHTYFTNYHTATCFDTIVSSSDSL